MAHKPICSKCSRELTPEELLLNAIYGQNPQLCIDCDHKANIEKCSQCPADADLKVNGLPYCCACAAKLYHLGGG